MTDSPRTCTRRYAALRESEDRLGAVGLLPVKHPSGKCMPSSGKCYPDLSWKSLDGTTIAGMEIVLQFAETLFRP